MWDGNSRWPWIAPASLPWAGGGVVVIWLGKQVRIILEERERESTGENRLKTKKQLWKQTPENITCVASPSLSILCVNCLHLVFFKFGMWPNEKLIIENEELSHFHPFIPQLLDTLCTMKKKMAWGQSKLGTMTKGRAHYVPLEWGKRSRWSKRSSFEKQERNWPSDRRTTSRF